MEEGYEILIYHSSCPLNLQPDREERSRPWNHCKTMIGCHCKGYRERTSWAWVKMLKKGRLIRNFFMSDTLMFNRRRQWQPTPVFLPRGSCGQRSFAQSLTWLKQLSMHACLGEGNVNPLQCPCLENPRDGGAWWAAVSGVLQTRTRLKRLSSSSSSTLMFNDFTECCCDYF